MSVAALLLAQTSPVATAAPDTAIGLTVATLLMLLGTLVHFVTTLAELEDKGQHFTPISYLRLHPWRSLSLVLCAWLALYVCFAMGECTRVTAVLIGFSCQAAADRLRVQANAKLSK